MKDSGLRLVSRWQVEEPEYNLSTEAQTAALLTTGNGYIGVRASLEELGSLGVQGCYVRGIIDTIVDMRLPYCDNLYMKTQYFDEDKLKDFERQECVVNLIDFLLIRFSIDGETFFPWQGVLHKWKRTLDMETGRLCREVEWESAKGDLSRFTFERFASFADDHIYCIKATVTPLNHSKPVVIESGMELRTKTYGQHVQIPVDSSAEGQNLLHINQSGPTYGFTCCTAVRHDLYGAENPVWTSRCDRKEVVSIASFSTRMGETYTLEKKVYLITSRDVDEEPRIAAQRALTDLQHRRYAQLLEDSLRVYQPLFAKMDVDIRGDDNADRSVRWSNYHTLISIPRNDSVHSLAAKALTGEVYNDFVWWDAEVYQTPVFTQTIPETVKNVILYRYRLLDAARENARLEGRHGARFPFTSAVTGKETIWIYVRHPFMQIHIVSDVAINVLRYYACTGDKDFLLQYGMEILLEASRYWIDRVEYVAERHRYEILTVTGTDEHHPYVDNNAYTNYSVFLVLRETARLYDRFRDECEELARRIGFSEKERQNFVRTADLLYLPFDEETGMIPQFDGYFQLDRELEIQGGSTAKSFQMKQSGLYNKSQVIKQPDVMLLFSYMDLDFGHEVYSRNWDYYEARCESSSSLSYPVHAICAADLDQPERAYKYLLKTARLDLDDEHDCAADGVHAACAAGAWLAAARGIAGMRMHAQGVWFAPHFIPWWESLSFRAVWHGLAFEVTVDNRSLYVRADASNTAALPLHCAGRDVLLEAGKTACFDTGINRKGEDSHHAFTGGDL